MQWAKDLPCGSCFSRGLGGLLLRFSDSCSRMNPSIAISPHQPKRNPVAQGTVPNMQGAVGPWHPKMNMKSTLTRMMWGFEINVTNQNLPQKVS